MRKDRKEIQNELAGLRMNVGGRPFTKSLPAVAAATATAATTTAVAAATAVTTTTAATATARTLGTSFIDIESASTEFTAIDGCDCIVAFRVIRHFDEREAAGLTRVAIGDNVDTVN